MDGRRIVLKKPLRIGRREWPAKEYRIPEDMPASLADWVLRKRADIAGETGGR